MGKDNVIPPHGGMGTEKRRMCITNSPECSGLNPCAPCHTWIMVRVLPAAMRAAGFAKNKEQAALFFKIYRESWKQMLSSPLPSPEEFPVPPTPPSPPSASPQAAEVAPVVAAVVEQANGHKAEVVSPPNGGTKLKRGDVKRMAEQEAESLVNNTHKE